MRKNRLGFTLIELLGVIVILGVIMSIAVGAYMTYVSRARKTAYETAEQSMKEATEGMFTDCIADFSTSFLCTLYDAPDPDDHRIVTLSDLIQGQYINEISDPQKEGSFCDAGKSYVFVYGEKPVEGSSNYNLTYKSCLYCSNYQTEGCEFDLSTERDFGIQIEARLGSELGNIYDSKWTTKDIWIHATSGDPYHFGIKRMEYATNADGPWTEFDGTILWTKEGFNRFYVRAVDNADNISKSAFVDLRIDKTLLNVKITGKRASDNKAVNSGDWVSGDLILTANTNNVASGVIYQWKECSSIVESSCNNISGATNKELRVTTNGEKYYRVITTSGSGLSAVSDPFTTRIDRQVYPITVTSGQGGTITVKNLTKNKQVSVAPQETSKKLDAYVDDEIQVSITSNAGFTNPKILKNGSTIENNSTFLNGRVSNTISASWDKATYTVTYDYATNGGTSVTKASAKVAYMDNVDLSPKATKSGYAFVGWNTDPNATTGLTTYQMPASNTRLYAIYKKVITITYRDTTTRTNSCVAYNKNTSCQVTLFTVNGKSGYSVSGWRKDTSAAAASYTSGSKQTFSGDTTLYAIWQKTVHLYSYDGGSLVKDSSGTVYSSGSGAHSSFAAQFGPTRNLSGYQFKGYRINNAGTVYGANATYSIQNDTKAYVYRIQTTVTLNVNCHVGGFLDTKASGNNRRSAVCYNSYDTTPYNYASYTYHASGHHFTSGLYGNVLLQVYSAGSGGEYLLNGSGDFPNGTLKIKLDNRSTTAQFSITQYNNAYGVQEYFDTFYVDRITLTM